MAFAPGAPRAMLPLCLVAAALVQGCGHEPTSRVARPEAPPETGEDALRRAHRLLQAAGVRNAWSVDEDAAARSVAAGLTEPVAVDLLARLMADCLAVAGRCETLHPLNRPPEGAALEASKSLVALMGEYGTTQSRPLLLRLEARGLWEANKARTRQLERLSANARAERPCRPPQAERLARVRASLADFVVFERSGGALTTRSPTPTELEDLAYLLASTDGAGPAVGTTEEAAGGSFARPGPPDAERARMYDGFVAAKLAGDHVATVAGARAFLGSLGYPGPIQTARASEYAWGGAQYSYVMRDLALADEVLGNDEEALSLHRRTNPGGGACGTSVPFRWAEQVRGVIRAAERLGRCGDVVAERLIAVGGAEPDPHGTLVLREAGFDVTRLYRGALATVERDAARTVLDEAIEQGPSALRASARARLERQGAEAWERRIFALEGLADVAQREAIPTLVDLVAHGASSVRVRALDALGRLAERPEYDPCVPGRGGGWGSSEWSREIRSLGRACDTKLPRDEAASLSGTLVPLLRDRDPEVRRATAAALGALGAPRSVTALRALAQDPFQPAGIEVCEQHEGESRCRQPYPVREAAQEAIARIERLEAGAAEQ